MVKPDAMGLEMEKMKSMINFTRYHVGQNKGHYESFFQRANHPEEKKAFWIRYTIFTPEGKPEKAIGELWAIYFDGEKGKNTAVKTEFPISRCRFDNHAFDVRLGESTLNAFSLQGSAGGGRDTISWDLEYSSDKDPLFLLPVNLYEGGFPKAKALVGSPLAVFNGTIHCNGEKIRIKNWVGSQNHNWGERHTDQYAWGQVSGFDNAPDSFLEVGSATLKMAFMHLPMITVFVLRHNGREYSFNTYRNFIFNKAHYNYFDWHFSGETDGIRLDGIIRARYEDFVGLNYYNPPGGSKTCLNSKVAGCHLTLTYPEGKTEILRTENRAAFEILTEDNSHGIRIQC